MNEAFLSLGGNMGNRAVVLNAALKDIEASCGLIVKTSQLYETEAWGYESANKYLNQVIQIKTHLSANELLANLMKIEKKAGRLRGKQRYSDRLLDLDLLFYGKQIINSEVLQVPHPRLHQRNFVLQPLVEIAPRFKHPVLNKSIQQLLSECTDTLTAKPYPTFKKHIYICFEGNIGSGKSTMAKALAKKLKLPYLPEKFEHLSVLPLFYKDPKTYATQLEYAFLKERFEQLKSITPIHKTVVSDFSFYKCLWFAQLNLSKTEFIKFKVEFNQYNKQLSDPDLIIHLSTLKANLLKNIQKRGRPFEKNMNGDYLLALDDSYNKGLNRLKQSRILTINIQKYDLKSQKDALILIENYLKENFGLKV